MTNAPTPAGMAELHQVTRDLLSLVLLKYGDLDKDVNKVVASAQDALAALAPVAAEGGEKDKLRIAVEALERIERWHGEFPPTGKFWPRENGEPNRDHPTSYATEYGSNGERDFMRSLARQALPALRTEPTGGGEGA